MIDTPSIFPINSKQSTNPDFISLGRLVKLKGYQDVIIALNEIKTQLPDWEYHIIGEGPYKDKLISFYSSFYIRRAVSSFRDACVRQVLVQLPQNVAANKLSIGFLHQTL